MVGVNVFVGVNVGVLLGVTLGCTSVAAVSLNAAVGETSGGGKVGKDVTVETMAVLACTIWVG